MDRQTLETKAPLWTGIHSSAVIHDDAVLAPDVTVGPGAVIGPGVVVGPGTTIGSHALIERDTEIGQDCAIHHGAVLGTDPQDLKFEGEETELVVGDRTVIREYATVNRGTRAEGRTSVGSDCLLMAYSHVAHDCHLGNHVILANSVNMGGHVTIGDWAIVGGLTAIHQFVRIGTHAFVGGASRVPKDVAPFVRAAGNPLAMAGLNTVGLRRRGFDAETRSALKQAYRRIFTSDMNVTQAVARVREELGSVPAVAELLDFIEATERGLSL
jgi:UDP-N-acetylglucosamine acyltransferase